MVSLLVLCNPLRVNSVGMIQEPQRHCLRSLVHLLGMSPSPFLCYQEKPLLQGVCGCALRLAREGMWKNVHTAEHNFILNR